MSQPVRNADELPAVGTPVERPVGRMEPERAAFEAWFSEGGKWPAAVRRSGDGYMLAAAQSAWTAWQAADARWEAALRQTWQMVDPLNPAGTPGSYARGQDSGIVAALNTLRANLKTPNVRSQPGAEGDSAALRG